MAMTMVALLLLAAACNCCCYSVVNTAGKTFLGFKFDVDTTSYRNLSIDASTIMGHVKAKRYAQANQVYSLGLYSKRSTGALRALKATGNAVRPGELFFVKASTFYKTPTQTPRSYIESYMGTAITATSTEEKVAVGLQWILLSFVGHELDVAYSVVGKPDGSSLAIAEISDAFGLFYGYPDTLGLYKQWAEIEKWGPTCGAGSVLTRIINAFKQMQAAAKSNKAATFKSWYTDFFNKQVVTVYLRGIVYASGRTAKSAAWQRYASGYLKIIQPLLASAAAPSAATLQSLLSRTALASPAVVRSHVSTIATKQGISAAAIGLC